MSKAEDRVKKIHDEHVGASNKRMLVVEGTDDIDAFRLLLNTRKGDWELDWALAEAGNKSMALDMAPLAPTWLFLVDRDEWSASQISQYSTQLGNLLFLPRFCIESYLVDPDELWEAIPVPQRAKIAGGLPQLQAAIHAQLVPWRRHAALWHVINPLWTDLRALGFQNALLKSSNVPNDVQLRATLNSWSAFIDANRIMNDVQAEIARIGALDASTFLRQFVYAKDFYPRVVNYVLNTLLGSMSAKDRRLAIFADLPVPADLGPLWQRMGV